MEVTLFPDPVTLLWTLLNIVLLIAFPVAVITYIIRLNRRIRRLEERIDQLDK